MLKSVAESLYNDLVVVMVDVDQYPAWAGQFVPKNYGAAVWQSLQGGLHSSGSIH